MSDTNLRRINTISLVPENLIEAQKTKCNLPCSERVYCHKFQQEVTFFFWSLSLAGSRCCCFPKTHCRLNCPYITEGQKHRCGNKHWPQFRFPPWLNFSPAKSLVMFFWHNWDSHRKLILGRTRFWTPQRHPAMLPELQQADSALHANESAKRSQKRNPWPQSAE